jgi:hypothetical protein
MEARVVRLILVTGSFKRVFSTPERFVTRNTKNVQPMVDAFADKAIVSTIGHGCVSRDARRIKRNKSSPPAPGSTISDVFVCRRTRILVSVTNYSAKTTAPSLMVLVFARFLFRVHGVSRSSVSPMVVSPTMEGIVRATMAGRGSSAINRRAA